MKVVLFSEIKFGGPSQELALGKYSVEGFPELFSSFTSYIIPDYFELVLYRNKNFQRPIGNPLRGASLTNANAKSGVQSAVVALRSDLSPEALHSGFTPRISTDYQTVEYIHPICNPATGKDVIDDKEPVTITAIAIEDGQPSYRMFSPSKVKDSMQTAIRAKVPDHDDYELNPGRFGLELIEGTPMVRFQLEERELNQVMVPEPSAVVVVPPPPPQEDDLTQITNVGEARSRTLKNAGYTTFAMIGAAQIAQLTAILGNRVNIDMATQIRDDARALSNS